MSSKDFIALLSENYNEPLVRANNQPNLKLTFIKKWLDDEFGSIDLSPIAEKVIKNFIPTSINPCPLIPHIKAILDDGKDQDIELAREVADRIITAVSRYGYTNPKEAEKYIGDIGWQVVNRYGRWIRFSQGLLADQIEIVRAHLRDSALTTIKRAKRGEALEGPVTMAKITGNDLVKALAEQKAIK